MAKDHGLQRTIDVGMTTYEGTHDDVGEPWTEARFTRGSNTTVGSFRDSNEHSDRHGSDYLLIGTGRYRGSDTKKS